MVVVSLRDLSYSGVCVWLVGVVVVVVFVWIGIGSVWNWSDDLNVFMRNLVSV